MSDIRDIKYSSQLARALAAIHTEDEAYRLLADLCTDSEVSEMSKRLCAAEMLRDGVTYSEIAERTGLSTATITRVNRALRHGNDGYLLVIERIAK